MFKALDLDARVRALGAERAAEKQNLTCTHQAFCALDASAQRAVLGLQAEAENSAAPTPQRSRKRASSAYDSPAAEPI